MMTGEIYDTCTYCGKPKALNDSPMHRGCRWTFTQIQRIRKAQVDLEARGGQKDAPDPWERKSTDGE